MTAANENTTSGREDEEEILSLAMAGAPNRMERNDWTAYNLMKSSYFNKLHLVSHVLRIKYDKWRVHGGDAIWCSHVVPGSNVRSRERSRSSRFNCGGDVSPKNTPTDVN